MVAEDVLVQPEAPRGNGVRMTAASDAYEELTRTLYGRIAALRGVSTLRLDHDVKVPGKATRHQVDVLWQFIEPGTGVTRTVLLECRHYASAINQGKLLSFKGVIDDIAAYQGDDALDEPHGVMVTRTGYQVGARRVANTWGIDVVELRAPLPKDLEGRLSEIVLTVKMRTPSVTDLSVQLAEPHEVADFDAGVRGLIGAYDIEYDDGRRERMLDVLLNGELNDLGEDPRTEHRVVRLFDPPVRLWVGDVPIATVVAAAANVGESESTSRITVGGRTYLAYLIRDALSGECTWFADDGRIWRTN